MRCLTCFFFQPLLVSFLLAGSGFFALPATAQVTSEVGGGLGGLNYRGEISPNYRILNNRPAGTVFYKKDLSAPITARAGLTVGALRASDENVKRDGAVLPVHAQRQADFRAFLVELMAGAEYNFLDYYDQKRRTRWTPYVFTGIAGYYASTTTTYNISRAANQTIMTQADSRKLTVAFPIGIGIKYALTYNINLIVEAGARRTFGDTFDNLSEMELPVLAQPGDPDWYYYNGVSLSYTFYKIVCPAIYKSQPGLLR